MSARCTWASGVCAAPRRRRTRRYDELVETEGRPRLRYWIGQLKTEGILDSTPSIYGYFPAVSEGDTVHVLTEPKPGAPV